MCDSGTLGGSHTWAWEGHKLEEGDGRQELCPLYAGPGGAVPWAQQHLILYMWTFQEKENIYSILMSLLTSG